MSSSDNTRARRIRNQRKYREFRARALRQLGDLCHICGHAGATDLDHVVPVSVDPSRALDLSNVLPAHGNTGCPQCPTKQNGARRACNQEKGDGRQAIAGRYAKLSPPSPAGRGSVNGSGPALLSVAEAARRGERPPDAMTFEQLEAEGWRYSIAAKGWVNGSMTARAW